VNINNLPCNSENFLRYLERLFSGWRSGWLPMDGRGSGSLVRAWKCAPECFMAKSPLFVCLCIIWIKPRRPH